MGIFRCWSWYRRFWFNDKNVSPKSTYRIRTSNNCIHLFIITGNRSIKMCMCLMFMRKKCFYCFINCLIKNWFNSWFSLAVVMHIKVSANRIVLWLWCQFNAMVTVGCNRIRTTFTTLEHFHSRFWAVLLRRFASIRFRSISFYRRIYWICVCACYVSL